MNTKHIDFLYLFLSEIVEVKNSLILLRKRSKSKFFDVNIKNDKNHKNFKKI